MDTLHLENQVSKRYKSKSILWLFCILFSISLSAGEEDRRNPLSGLYLSPLKVISLEEIKTLDTDKRITIDEDSGIALRDEPKPVDPNAPDVPVVPGADLPVDPGQETGPKNLETKIREAEGLLKRYYSQFIEEKRIWEDREKGNVYNSRTEMNDIRLLLWQSTHKHTETFVIRDSPVLYYLHIKLAKLYVESEKFAPALRHYLAAFRYHPLEMTEEGFRTGEWQKEDLLGYDEGSAKEHERLYQEWIQAEQKYKKAKDDIHLKESNWIREGKKLSDLTPQSKLWNEELKIVDQTRKTAKFNYEDSYNKRYLAYLNKRKQVESSELYAFANVVKKLEDDNKERLKIVNKLGTAGKGIYVLFDYKRNTDFFAYELILERAYRIWNQNPNVLNDIAEQFRQDGKKEKAADFYEKALNEYLKNPNPTEEEKEKIIKANLRLATINADLKRNILAGNYYESFFSLSPDTPEKTRVSYEIGVFFNQKIGDPERGSTFLTYWLEKNSKDWNPSLMEDTGVPEMESIAYFYLSKKDKKLRKFELEQNKLNIALIQWKKLDEKLILAEKERMELIEKKQSLKKDLMVTTLDDVLSQYRLMDLKIEDQEAVIRVLETKRNKIPLIKILFRLGVLAEDNRDFNKAKEYYEFVIKEGGETEVRVALKELERIKKILETGNIQPPINESI
ncbi:tetratricopeptide repeat protein [Leptospira sp. WS39.C2]